MNILTQFDPCMLMLSHYMQHVSYVRSPGKMLARSECDIATGFLAPAVASGSGVRRGIGLSQL